MGIFDGLKDAKTYEKGSYLSAGAYTLQIEKTIVKDTRKSGTGFIVEFKVIKSTCKDHPVDTKATWFQGMKDKDVAFGAIKGFMLAVSGLDETRDKETIKNDFDPNIESLMDDAITKNALKGSVVDVQVVLKKTQKGLDFSVHNWLPHQKAA